TSGPAAPGRPRCGRRSPTPRYPWRPRPPRNLPCATCTTRRHDRTPRPRQRARASLRRLLTVAVTRNGRSPVLGSGQTQSEGRTRPLLAPHGHFSTVVSHDVFDDGQAHAGTPAGTAPSGVHTVETLGDSLQVLLGDTDALVGATDVHAGTGYPHGDGDPGLLGAVGDGVGHQVTQCGAEQVLV